jgi:hypothetical protein
VSWTELQSSKDKHVIPLGGVRIIYAVLCEGFSISLYEVEYQEDWCWINRREFGRKRLFANRGIFRYLPTGTEIKNKSFSKSLSRARFEPSTSRIQVWMIIRARVLKKSLLFHEIRRFVTVILSHINLICNIPFYFFKIHFSIIHPFMLRTISFRFSYRNFVQTFLPHVIIVPPNSTSFDSTS